MEYPAFKVAKSVGDGRGLRTMVGCSEGHCAFPVPWPQCLNGGKDKHLTINIREM